MVLNICLSLISSITVYFYFNKYCTNKLYYYSIYNFIIIIIDPESTLGPRLSTAIPTLLTRYGCDHYHIKAGSQCFIVIVSFKIKSKKKYITYLIPNIKILVFYTVYNNSY